jgi:hypothetical protein
MKTRVTLRAYRLAYQLSVLLAAGWFASPLDLNAGVESSDSKLIFLQPAGGVGQNFIASTYDVVIADFNGDGHGDVAFPSRELIDVYYGDGAGHFSGPSTFAAGTFPQSLAVGDFNRDGKPDLAVGVVGFIGQGVQILLNNGMGGFSAPVMATTAGSPYQVVVADFNHDGFQDLAIPDTNPDSVLVLLGDGNGGFGAPVASAGGSDAMATGDFNEDGIVDLATADYATGEVRILLGNGAGGFSWANTYSVSPSNTTTLVVADFNHDNHQDVAVGVINNLYNVAVFLGNGDGSLVAEAPVALNDAQGVGAADVNGDGRIDLVTANYSNEAIGVAIGDGTGNFGLPRYYRFPYHHGHEPLPINITVGDLNGDGKPDLATANYGTGGSIILLSK